MVVLRVRFVNLPLNQRVKGVYGYAVTLMNVYLWNNPLIPLKLPQTPLLHPA